MKRIFTDSFVFCCTLFAANLTYGENAYSEESSQPTTVTESSTDEPLPTKPLEKVNVVITQFVSHKALNDVRDGAIDIIKDCTKSKFDVNFSFSNASGNALVARQIAQKHVSERPDVVVAISTLSAQSMIGASRGSIPIVFGAVTDPKAAQIQGNNVTGVTDKAPFKDQILFIKSLLPHMKSIAVLYNPGEDNSRAALEALDEICRELSLTLRPAAVTKVVEISQAVNRLRGQADAIFIANDNLVASGFESLVLSAIKEQIPVFASDVMLVHRGAVAMRGIDYFQTGQQAGMQVCSILDQKPVKDIPVENPAVLKLIVNAESAKAFNIVIPETIIQEADEVIGQKPKEVIANRSDATESHPKENHSIKNHLRETM